MTRMKRARPSAARSDEWSEIVRGLPGWFKKNSDIANAIARDPLVIDFLDRQYGSCSNKKKVNEVCALITWLDLTADFSKKWREDRGRLKLDKFIRILDDPWYEHRERIKKLKTCAAQFAPSEAQRIVALADKLDREGKISPWRMLEANFKGFWNAADFKLHSPACRPEAAWNGMVVRRIGREVLSVYRIKKPYATIARLAQLAGCPTVTRKYARATLKR